MAIPDLLIVDPHGTQPSRAYRLQNGTTLSAQIKNDITSDYENNPSPTKDHRKHNQIRIELNNVLNFFTNEEPLGPLVHVDNDIYILITTGAWGVIEGLSISGDSLKSDLLTYSPPGTTKDDRYTGMFVIDTSDNVEVVRGTLAAGTNKFAVSAFSNAPSSGTWLGTRPADVFQNNLIWAPKHSTGERTYIYNEDASSMTEIDETSTLSEPSTAKDFCVYKGRYFRLRSNQPTDDNVKLWELVGNSWVVRHTFTGVSVDSGGTIRDEGGHLLWTDGSSLFAFILNESGGDYGWSAFELTVATATTFNESDITDPVIPAAYRVGGGSGAATNRWTIFVDFIDGGTPNTIAVHLWLLDTHSSGTWTYYTWTDNATVLTNQGTSVGSQYVLPMSKGHQGGDYAWPGTTHVSIIITDDDPESSGDGTKIYFRAAGDAGTANKTVKLWADPNGDSGTPLGTTTQLDISAVTVESGSPAGSPSVSGGNSIINLDADKDVLYSATVDTAALYISGEQALVLATIE